MTNDISRRWFLAASATALLPATGWAEAPAASLRPVPRPKALNGAERVIRAADLKGEVAFAVADVGTGEVLEAVGGNRGLPPASVAKTITALYALDVLGPDFRFETRLIATGPIKNGILDGDLVLVGGGDPLLDTDALATMAANLRKAGLREVRGAFKVYNGALPYVHSIDPDQPHHLGYSPAISGIALNFNRVHFEWKRGASGYDVSMDARSKNYSPGVDMARMMVENRRAPVYTYETSARIDKWSVAKGQLGKGGARWLPVRKPALYAGDVFRTLARVNGIVLGRVHLTHVAPQGTVLVSHQSKPLRDILRGMLKYSTNLTAEMVGLTATTARGARPRDLRDSAAEMNRWAGEKFGAGEMAMVDHSGLGDASRLTPRDLVAVLVAAQSEETLRPLLKPYTLRDRKGRKVKDHPITVDAKTGTLHFVSGLGGYVKTADGADLAFAIFTADIARRATLSRAERERPKGARSWNTRSRRLQQDLIERWGSLYGS